MTDDPRIEAAVAAFETEVKKYPQDTISRLGGSTWGVSSHEALTVAFAAADAADKAADPPWIRVRCDEETIELIAAVLGESMQIDIHDDARAVLAALRGEQ